MGCLSGRFGQGAVVVWRRAVKTPEMPLPEGLRTDHAMVSGSLGSVRRQ